MAPGCHSGKELARTRGRATVGARLSAIRQILIPLPLLLLALACGKEQEPQKQPQKQPKGPASRTTPLSWRFDEKTQPFAFLLPDMPAPGPEVTGIRAEDCGKCHEKIYEEWKQSTHAKALSDLQFQAELAKPDSPRWLCLNCHTPLQAQRVKLTIGLDEGQILKPVLEWNPSFDPKLQQEAITCAVCHLRLDAQGKSYILGPRGGEDAPHPVRKDPARLRAICLRCHDPVGEPITQNLLCWFTTRSELEKGGGKETDCSACHMPVVERLLVESKPELPMRKVHQHTWPGGGIPKSYDGYAALLRNGWGKGAWTSGLTIQAEYKGGRVLLSLHNERAGHSVPTADPERFVQVRLRAFDAEGTQIWETKERIGQTWAWNPARKLGDNRIKPGEERKLAFDPPAATRLVLDLLNVRLSKGSAQHMVKTQNLDEKLLPKANEKIKKLGWLYPFASYIHRTTWESLGEGTPGIPADGPGKIADPKTLIQLSKDERRIPIDKRSY